MNEFSTELDIAAGEFLSGAIAMNRCCGVRSVHLRSGIATPGHGVEVDVVVCHLSVSSFTRLLGSSSSACHRCDCGE
jgi:hypothetical protein